MGYLMSYVSNLSHLIKIGLLSVFCMVLSLRGMYTAERQNICIKVVEYTGAHINVDMFDIGIWRPSPDWTYMIKPSFFIKQGLHPVGIIVHNKGTVPIKLSEKSIRDHDIQPRLQRCMINASEPMIQSWLIGSLALLVTGCINILERDLTMLLCGPVTKRAMLVSILATGYALYSELHAQKSFIDVLSRHMLTADRIVRPGQKIIVYTLFDRYQQGIDRTEFGGLSGIELDLFDLGDQVYESFSIGEYDHAI